MADPNWNNGFYYDGLPPHTGMKLARRLPNFLHSLPPGTNLPHKKLQQSRIVRVQNGTCGLAASFGRYLRISNPTHTIQPRLASPPYVPISS